MKVTKIDKSYKYEGYVMTTGTNGREFKRRFYERVKTPNGNKLYTYFDGRAYSFKWDFTGAHAINIIDEGEYKDFMRDNNIAPTTISEEIKEQMVEVAPVKPLVIEVKPGEVKHEKFQMIKNCIENDIPVYLVGPAGSGKNHTLEQIAKELEMDFYFTNSIQQEFKLTGFIDAGGKFHETEFYKAFLNGGLFFLDEMDASIPEVLVLLNAAIANKYFEFPNGKISAHEDFRVVAAGNTVGNGADEQYTGRLTLDQATLDRFAIIHFDYCLAIEMHLAKGNTDLVTFVREMRKQAKEKGIRATFSYRCITMVRKLEGTLALTDIMLIAVFKGMDKDTINTFRANGQNKYDSALRTVQVQS